MNPTRHLLFFVAIGLVLAAPGAAQDAAAPAEPAAPAVNAEPAAPAVNVEPAAPAADPDTPATDAAPAADAAPSDGSTPDAAPDAPADEPAAAQSPEAAQPSQSEVTVTQQGDWEIGCLAGTTNCEMQQVAVDETDNPVILVRVIKLPAEADADALMIFNTPLGTLLPPGIGFRIDSAEGGALPFEWCVQEGCVVRLGLRPAEIAAMKRGRTVSLTVTSIADPNTPVELALSLAGFTAAYDSLTAPAGAPAQQ